MAIIQFLNTVNFNGNETQRQVIWNLAADPTAVNSELGMIYYNTASDELRVCTNATTPTWTAVGTTYSFDAGAENGTDQPVNNGNLLDITASDAYIATAVSKAGSTVTVDVTHSLSGVTANNYAYPSSITVNAAGHITSITAGSAPYTDADVDAHLNTSTATNGQILSYNTGTGDYEWVDDSTGTVTSVDEISPGTSSGTPIVVNPTTGAVKVQSMAYAGTTNVGHVPSGGSATTFLRGDGTWVTPTDNNTTSLPVKNSAGTTQFTSTQATGIRFLGSGTTSVSFTPGTQLVEINSADQFTGTVTSITTPADGGLTGGTITTTGELRLKNYASLSDSTVMGWDNSNNQLEDAPMTYSGNNVTVTGDLTVTGGDITLSGTGRIQGIDTITAGTDAVNRDYVDNAVLGTSSFQGGYNAATNTPDLDSSPSTSIKQGWFWAVTVAGSFFSETVQPGDLIFANQDNPGATFANWTVVQSGQDIAGAGSSDGTTTKGVAGFDSAYFDVSPNGWVQIKADSIELGTETTGIYVTSVVESTVNNRKGIAVVTSGGGDAKTETVGLNIIGLTNLTGLAAADDFVVYDASGTPENKRVGADEIASYVKSTIEVRDAYIPLDTGTSWIASSSTAATGTISWTIDVSANDLFNMGPDLLATKVEVICLDAANTGFEAYQTLNPSITRNASGDITIEFVKKLWSTGAGGTLPGQGDFAALVSYVGEY